MEAPLMKIEDLGTSPMTKAEFEEEPDYSDVNPKDVDTHKTMDSFQDTDTYNFTTSTYTYGVMDSMSTRIPEDDSNLSDGDHGQVTDLRTDAAGTTTSHSFSVADHLHNHQLCINDKNKSNNNNTHNYNFNYSVATTNNSEYKVAKNECINVDNTQKKACCNISPFFRQLMAVLTVCGMGASSGIFQSFSAVAIPSWKAGPMNLTDNQAKWFASLPSLVTVPGSFFGGLICEALGPKQALTVLVPFVAQSWALISFSGFYSHLLLARFSQGLSMSVINVGIVIYPAEVGATQTRGIMIGFCDSCYQFGVLLTYTLGVFLESENIAAVYFGLLCVHMLALTLTPESPLWLAKRGRIEEATQSVKSLRRSSLTPDTLWSLSQSSSKAEASNGLLDQFKLLKEWRILKYVLVGSFLLIFKELTGQCAVTAYTVQIFQLSGSTIDPYWCTFVLGLVRMLGCLLSMTIMERFPRRITLCVGDLLTSGSMMVISVYFLCKEFEQIPEGNSFGWVPFLGMISFTALQGCIIGPVTWALVGEILPNDIRNLGGGIVVAVFSLFQFLVTITFPDIVKTIGSGWTYFCYACFSLLGAFFVMCFVPETRGLTIVQKTDIEKEGDQVTKESWGRISDTSDVRFSTS
ncbi:facilitated trehalose transporter Tret1-2 homolog [Oratosquilla oratoria]|uniref:facilitated trehalose transporter Tret1-2 homolog n=1 Tax=Oratosquilla oratoria TaxID=337810 RepID=UPI003F75EBAA